ncbi:MAG: MafI family immunity protein [Tepidisphaeraceae bacterium]|jgi:hypothetical protein
MIDVQKIYERLLDLLNELKAQLPPEDYKISFELIEAGEGDLALEEICNQIKVARISIPQRTYGELAALGTTMDMEEKPWLMLQSQVKP